MREGERQKNKKRRGERHEKLKREDREISLVDGKGRGRLQASK